MALESILSMSFALVSNAMKDFSHPGTDEKTAVDLNRAIESTLTVASNEWKYVAEVETDFAPDLPLVPCLAGEINQVFLNLIVNAAHAIQKGWSFLGGGRVTFALTATVLSLSACALGRVVGKRVAKRRSLPAPS